GENLRLDDPKTTSGYNTPRYTLDKPRISPDTFFAKTQVTGSHENAVLALAQGTVDVAANWWNADDDSNLTRMLNKGMLKNPDGSAMKNENFRIILKSELIINSPTAALSGGPARAAADGLRPSRRCQAAAAHARIGACRDRTSDFGSGRRGATGHVVE